MVKQQQRQKAAAAGRWHSCCTCVVSPCNCSYLCSSAAPHTHFLCPWLLYPAACVCRGCRSSALWTSCCVAWPTAMATVSCTETSRHQTCSSTGTAEKYPAQHSKAQYDEAPHCGECSFHRTLQLRCCHCHGTAAQGCCTCQQLVVGCLVGDRCCCCMCDVVLSTLLCCAAPLCWAVSCCGVQGGLSEDC